MPYQFIDGGGRLIELDDDDPVPVSWASRQALVQAATQTKAGPD